MFDSYFQPQVNVVFAQGKFWDRRQQEGEDIEEFIRVIYKLGESCSYGQAMQEHIRDKLCHGISDRRLAAELRGNGQLTLNDVLTRC
jgi:hypothetical protein